MKIIIVQSRLDSSRLPGKALLPLNGKPILAWVLDTMRMVHADRYFLATDKDSAEELSKIAESCGWETFVGPKEDVLERFCLLIEETNASIVIRATGDNPFLFYEAARALSIEYDRRNCDYITWTGLPHGSGVEIFNAKSLLKAKELTDNLYDHEHVGPSLYGHPESFKSCMLPSIAEWNHPDYRTTVDTEYDYRRALRIASHLPKLSGRKAYDVNEIWKAINECSVKNPVLLIPSIKKGHGTGHLRRCLSIATETGFDIYLPEIKDKLDEIDSLICEAKENKLEAWQIVTKLPKVGQYSLIVSDSFMLDRQDIVNYSSIAPLIAIDEGSNFHAGCDYLLDIIPSCNLDRKPNLENNAFIPLPKNRRTQNISTISNVLVSIGGEDPASLTLSAATAFALNKIKVTAIASHMEQAEKQVPDELKKIINIIPPVQNLREKLYNYDLVVTHYGFTAFEAVAAGCAVVLVATTPLHALLARKYGFTLLTLENLTKEQVTSLISNAHDLSPSEKILNVVRSEKRTLSNFISSLSQSERLNCPICSSYDTKNCSNIDDPVVARTATKTYRKCSHCGMIYLAWTMEVQKNYDSSYFFDDYKKQYGKTYLEDFQTIKNQCVRRMSLIDSVFLREKRTSFGAKKNGRIPAVLDIGCAFGPFLESANDAGWQPFGTDISADAIDYVQNKLHYPAVCASFPDVDTVNEFGVQEFDAVTMWYVIEHFRNIDVVLKSVSKLVKKGGVFAFSTPSGSGVSAVMNHDSFFNQSPSDHYSIWTLRNTSSILSRYGFKIDKIISTGHHPERFPLEAEKKSDPTSFTYKILNVISKTRRLGDTFEVYCIKK